MDTKKHNVFVMTAEHYFSSRYLRTRWAAFSCGLFFPAVPRVLLITSYFPKIPTARV